MPCFYRLLAEPALLHTSFQGTVNDEEFVRLYRDALHDPAYALGTHEFADLRAVEHFRVSADALRDVVRLTEHRYAGADAEFRSAVVAMDDAAYAVGRMYEVFSGGTPERMRVFRTVAEAMGWLGLADAELVARLDAPSA